MPDPSPSFPTEQQAVLERCWRLECDIDPMILRARMLRHQGWPCQALCLEQELLPLF